MIFYIIEKKMYGKENVIVFVIVLVKCLFLEELFIILIYIIKCFNNILFIV